MTKILDTRLQIAHRIVNSCGLGEITKVLKTTRAGATTSLLLSLLHRKHVFLVLEPTNKIIKNTIMNDVKILSGRDNLIIIHIPSNHECLINKERLKANPLLEHMPYIPLPMNCKECEFFDECPITQILRVDRFDGIALTYDKLAALVLSAEMNPKSIAAEILGIITGSIDALVLDEAHELMYHRISSVELYDKVHVLHLYKRLQAIENSSGTDFQRLRLLLVHYYFLTREDDIRGNMMHLEHMLEEGSDPRSWGKLQAKSLPNPRQNLVLFNDKSKFYNGKLSEESYRKSYSAIFNNIMQLLETEGNDTISISDVVALCDILSILTAEEISLQVQKKVKRQDKGWTINSQICTVDRNRILMLANFLISVQHKCKTFVTSATFGSYDYSQLAASGTTIKNVLFGNNGDPLETNAKLTIFADTKSYTGVGRYSTYKFMEEIKRRCTDVMDIHGSHNCIILCRNIDDCEKLKQHFKNTKYEAALITYYRAPEVMGVESNRRVGILVGAAHKPSHSFDVMHTNYTDSQILREESMHADTWQALSRVKDPNGNDPSVVYALGCSENDMRNVVNWGISRQLEITEPFVKGEKRIVEVHVDSNPISQPEVVLTKKWPETLTRGKLCQNYLYSKPPKVPNIFNYGTFQRYQYKTNSKCSLHNDFFGHKRVSTLIKRTNRTFSKETELTDELSLKHTNGEAELHFYCLQPNNTVNFIMFQSTEEYPISRLKLHLDKKTIPYVIEKVDNLLRVWILTENTLAINAKNLGQDIMRKAGFKVRGNKEIDAYPKQVKRNSRSNGDLIRMPFGKNSQILVNGKFVDDFDELDFGHLENTDKLHG
jgi:hypothetical protein